MALARNLEHLNRRLQAADLRLKFARHKHALELLQQRLDKTVAVACKQGEPKVRRLRVAPAAIKSVERAFTRVRNCRERDRASIAKFYRNDGRRSSAGSFERRTTRSPGYRNRGVWGQGVDRPCCSSDFILEIGTYNA